DNYGIHDTVEVRRSLATEAGRRIRLHFLPPYCPDHNRIERVWQDLHANVTRNHRCSSMTSLMKNVRRWMDQRHSQARLAA
ncbi:IS630 family transposase, partial [bacterium]|nr:IS630 family transposase [bacterium]